jgi:hypothetical protein
MTRRLLSALGLAGLFVALTVALTWPQAAHLRTHVPSHDDSLLSVWRIAWIAHAIETGVPVMDANTFHPEPRTFAYTDAVLLQGVAAAPFIIAGASPVLVYNLIILASMALSGLAACGLAHRLTGSLPAGVVAGTIFAFATYRVDHYMHLELQATVFVPLALWALDRALQTGHWRDMAAFGACLVLQIISGIYYAVFLATALAIAVPIAWWRLDAPARRRFALQMVVVGALSGLAAAPYLSVYMQNRNSVGERSADEVRRYSAIPADYLVSDPRSMAYGAWSERQGSYGERRLFPGALALLLAAVGLWGWSARKTTVLVVGATGFLLSLGLNTQVYEAIREVVFTYRGLRAPARAGMLVLLAVSLFAAYGWARLVPRRRAVAATAAVLGLLYLEYAAIPPEWLVLPTRPPALARWLSQQPRSVVVELPLPRADSLHTIYDGLYMYASTFHWQPTVNGYSGFYPRSYIELVEVMKDFPAPEAIAYLQSREVDLIVLHGGYLGPDRLGAWSAALAARPDVQLVAELDEDRGSALVFRLMRATGD